MNIISKDVKKSKPAVEKSEGAIKPHTIITGIIIGTNAPLKSLINSCRFPIDLARYIINASLAKSET
jgi:hypothetical protein